MTTPADVLKMIKDKEVKFIGLRFTDTRGKEQHVSVPAKAFSADKFESGHGAALLNRTSGDPQQGPCRRAPQLHVPAR